MEKMLGAIVTFACHACGKSVAIPADRRGGIEECLHCGSYVDVPSDAVPSSPPDEPCAPREPAPRPKAQLWIEILAVLCLVCFPDIFYALAVVVGVPGDDSPFVYQELSLMIRSLQVAAPLLVILSLSREPWSRFGIVRFHWIPDVVGGTAICCFALLLRGMIGQTFPADWHPPGAVCFEAVRTRGFLACVLSVASNAANGVAEELAMRGYLIPRLERLLGSAWAAVLVSTVLFASYHVYQGPAGVIGASVTGLVYGASFCWWRRLWPLCVAHTLHNIVISL